MKKFIVSLAAFCFSLSLWSQTASDFEAEAKQGNAEAQLQLGNCYVAGRGVNKDYKQAAYWLNKAAEQDVANAQFLIGLFYTLGYGVEIDYTKALYWLKKAAVQGHDGAQENLDKYQSQYESYAQIKNTVGKKIYWYEKYSYNTGDGTIGQLLSATTGIGIVSYVIRFTAIIESVLGESSVKAIISNAVIEDPEYGSINYLKYKEMIQKEANKEVGKTRAIELGNFYFD
jgi:hypothetical protein